MHFPAPERAVRPALPTTIAAAPSTSGIPDQNAGTVSSAAGTARPRAVPPALSLRSARGTTTPKTIPVTTTISATMVITSGQSWANAVVAAAATRPTPADRGDGAGDVGARC